MKVSGVELLLDKGNGEGGETKLKKDAASEEFVKVTLLKGEIDIV